jgi:hypothetical protein
MKSNLSLSTEHTITNAHNLSKLRHASCGQHIQARRRQEIREIRGEEGTANISPEAAVAEVGDVEVRRYVLVP